MLPNRPFFIVLAVASLMLALPALDESPLLARNISPFAAAIQGASPQEGPMPQAKAVLRRVLCRKPVPFCIFPDRDDALSFLSAYMVETLECGHQLDTFFNPPVETLTAKYRRCRECDEAEKAIEIGSGKKKPAASVGIAATERKRVPV